MAAADYDDVWRQVYGDMQEIGPVHRHMRRLLSGLLAELDFADAIDVGCGAGHNLELLKVNQPSRPVSGVDVSEEALRRARTRGDGDFYALDIERTAPAGRWDLVFSALVLEHLNDDVAALGHLRAISRRHLVLATICGDMERYRPWEEQVGHVRNYRRGELEQKLQASGFGIRRAIYWGFPFYSPIMRLLQNQRRAEPSFRRSTRALARALYALYRLNSSRRGDLLIVHATVV